MVLKKWQGANNRRDLSLAAIAFMIALVLWQMQGLFFVTYPFRLFVTMIHELGHGIASVLTGGTFLRFQVTSRGAGMAYTRGGVRFIVIQAGYLGTALFGAVLLYLANRVKRPGALMAGLGVFIGGLTLLYSGISLYRLSLVESVFVAATLAAALYLVLTSETGQGRYWGLGAGLLGGALLIFFTNWHNALTVVVGVSSAIALIVIGYRGSRDVVVIGLNFLAFLVGLQAITDTWVLLRIVTLPHSMMPLNDASAMAHAVGGSAVLWALCWVVMDVIIFSAAVYVTFIRPARR